MSKMTVRFYKTGVYLGDKKIDEHDLCSACEEITPTAWLDEEKVCFDCIGEYKEGKADWGDGPVEPDSKYDGYWEE